MISFIATYKVKEDKIEEIKKVVDDFVSAVKDNEPMTLYYSAFQDKKDPSSFIHFMVFDSEEAKNIHEKAEYTKNFVDLLLPNCEVGNQFTELNYIKSNQTY